MYIRIMLTKRRRFDCLAFLTCKYFFIFIVFTALFLSVLLQTSRVSTFFWRVEKKATSTGWSSHWFQKTLTILCKWHVKMCKNLCAKSLQISLKWTFAISKSTLEKYDSLWNILKHANNILEQLRKNFKFTVFSGK